MNSANRRQFLAQAAGMGCGVLWADSVFAKSLAASPAPSPVESRVSGKSLLAKMKWFNESASAKQVGEQFVVGTKPKTDFWRKTFYEYVTDNGHFFFLPVTGDFTFANPVAAKYAPLYDQAGLLVRIDSANWMKCGLEL